VFGIGTETGEAADLKTNNVFWFFRPFVRLIFKKVSHDVMPDRSGARDTRDNPRIHGSIVVVANPGSHQIRGGKAQGPVISKIIGGASFNRDCMIGDN